MLKGKKGVIYGIRSPRTIGWAIAKQAREHGAELCLSYRGEREEAKALQMAQELGALALPCDVTQDEDIEALYARLGQEWGALDFIVHSVAFAPPDDMQAGTIGTSREGFAVMNDISAYSLVPLCRYAMPLMEGAGSVLAMTYIASTRVVPVYGPMGTAKAALECLVRYLANDIGPHGIRCNAVSAGPIETPAARGIPQFTTLLRGTEQYSPLHRNVSAEEVGKAAVFLLSDMASAITGEIIHVDCGMHIT
jgi:enoyl-[acyl-carrier protein] reductase I